MAVHKSFDNSKNKLRTSWDLNQLNTIAVSDTDKFSINFNNVQFSKIINTQNVVENSPILAGAKRITEIQLENFPEWIINYINVVITINSTPGFSLISVVNTASESFNNGTLKIGDITSNRAHHHWISKSSGDNYLIKVFSNPNVRVVDSLSGVGFSTSPIPMFLNISLVIQNPRIYENNRKNKT